MTDFEVPPEQELTPRQVFVVPADHETNDMLAYGPGWVPGQPLYARSSGVYSRPMFQIVPDIDTGTMYDKYWCHHCDVLWQCPDVEETVCTVPSECWMCGAETAHPNDEKENLVRREVVQTFYSLVGWVGA